MTAKTKNFRTLTMLLLAWAFAGCERSTRVRVEGGTSPVFVLSGSGALGNLAVYSPDYAAKAEVPFDENFMLWEIKPIAGDLEGAPVENLRSITYGVVPLGYAQARPQAGSVPALKEGQKYFYQFVTTGAPWASGYFEIRNSHVVSTDGPGVCFTRKDNKWIRITCPQ